MDTKIRLRTSIAGTLASGAVLEDGSQLAEGDAFSFSPGQVVSLSRELAHALADGERAELVEDEKPAKPAKPATTRRQRATRGAERETR